ncbi:uncharacterized protein LOC111829424 [Capsella rubella]|uniref:uncharacterized protein LOC111829424 n=1 Tax=Capsella rubella TaxID=81985 RepID=UPI000CD501C4|nr:uncharacterized protein LOC111829424 [Capsella rubella]
MSGSCEQYLAEHTSSSSANNGRCSPSGSSSSDAASSASSRLTPTTDTPVGGHEEVVLSENDDVVEVDPYDAGRSVCEPLDLADLIEFCEIDFPVHFRIPGTSERAFSCPDGWICLYTTLFSKAGMKFPLPAFLMDFCRRRDIALSQLSVSSLRNVVILQDIARRCGVTLTAPLMEEMMGMSRIANNPGLHYLNVASGCKLVMNLPNKVHHWENKYFFAEVDPFIVEDISIACRTTWNLAHEPIVKFLNPPVPNFVDTRELLKRQAALDFKTVPVLKERKKGKKGKNPRGRGGMVKMSVPSYSARTNKGRSGGRHEARSKHPVSRPPPDHGGRRGKDLAICAAAAQRRREELSFKTPAPGGDDSRKRRNSPICESGAAQKKARPNSLDPADKGKGVETPSTAIRLPSDLETPFLSDKQACGELLRDMAKIPGTLMASDLIESDLVNEWARDQLRANCSAWGIIEKYDRKYRNAKADNETNSIGLKEQMRAANRSRAKLEEVQKEKELLAEENKELRRKLEDAKVAEDEHEAKAKLAVDAKARSVAREMEDKYRTRSDRIRQYIYDSRFSLQAMMMKAQAEGCMQLAETLLESGVPIPDETLASLKSGERRWDTVVDRLEIEPLVNDGYVVSPPPSQRPVCAVLPYDVVFDVKEYESFMDPEELEIEGEEVAPVEGECGADGPVGNEREVDLDSNVEVTQPNEGEKVTNDRDDEFVDIENLEPETETSAVILARQEEASTLEVAAERSVAEQGTGVSDAEVTAPDDVPAAPDAPVVETAE